MRISYEWLCELVPGLDLPPEELAERLTLAGLELESLEDPTRLWKNVVVGEVKSLEPHPNADKLRVCQVEVGEGSLRQIVCGAPNVDRGQRVPVALPGASLPVGLDIAETKLRGVASGGMICSERELGLSEGHEGILVLTGAAAEATPGTPLAKALKVPTILDLSVTPNRGDCLSAIGLAREIAALLGKELREPEFSVKEGPEPVAKAAAVEVLDAALCPRYCARVIEGVHVGPSPDWLVTLLEAHGLRSISNIVDITNYILLLHGQPLHAFDLDRLAEGKILVRRAAEGEKITTLDKVERELRPGMLVIADPKGPVAIAGVMGGESSEVGEGTAQILIESAYFEPGQVRRTSRALGLQSESSYRFERGVDPRRVPVAMDHAAALMAELGGGTVRKGFIDVAARAFESRSLELRPERVNGLLGLEIPGERMAAHLRALGFEVSEAANRKTLVVGVPTFRSDIGLEADLIEEIARLEGYDRIPETLPAGARGLSPEEAWLPLRDRVEDVLAARGWHQAVHLSFIEPDWPERFGLADDDRRRQAVRIENPINEEQSLLRSALLPALVGTYARNRNRGVRQVRLFEVGRVFRAGGDLSELPHEELHVALIAGRAEEPTFWRSEDEGRTALFSVKADLEALIGRLGLELTLDGTSCEPWLHPGRRAALSLNGEAVGSWGELSPAVAGAYDLRERVVVAEINLQVLLAAVARADRVFVPIGRYPAIWHDLALLVSKEIPAARILGEAERAGAPLVQTAEVFDEYRGKGVEPGHRSLGVRLCYMAPDRTLTEEEVAQAEQKVLEALEKAFGARRRG